MVLRQFSPEVNNRASAGTVLDPPDGVGCGSQNLYDGNTNTKTYEGQLSNQR